MNILTIIPMPMYLGGGGGGDPTEVTLTFFIVGCVLLLLTLFVAFLKSRIKKCPIAETADCGISGTIIGVLLILGMAMCGASLLIALFAGVYSFLTK